MSDLLDQFADEIARERGTQRPSPLQPLEPAPEPSSQPRPQVTQQDRDMLAEEEDRNYGPFAMVFGADSAVSRAVDAAGSGVAKAAFEVGDFIRGEPEESDKTDFRRMIEGTSRARNEQSMAYGVTEGISQFATGMIGAGKVLKPIKAVQKLQNAGKAGRFAYESGRGAVAGAVVLDPHEERLSNLIEEFEVLQNPVTEFLAADPEDSAAMGRFKNALEGIGLDLALVGVFAATARGLKYLRAGDTKKATRELRKAEKLQAEAVEASQRTQAGRTAPSSIDESQLPAEPQTTASGQPGVKQAVSPEEGIRPARSEADTVPLRPKHQRGYEPVIEIDDTTAQRIVQASRRDIVAVEKYGSRAEAIAQGHKFDEANIPWQKLEGTDEIQTLVASTTKALRDQMDDIKGGDILKDEQVEASVRSAAEMFGQEPEVLMGELVRAGDQATNMVANMEASYIIARRFFEDAYVAAERVKAGITQGYGDSLEAAQEEVRKRLMAAADMLAQGSSMRAAAGRSMRRLRGEFVIRPEDVKAFREVPGDELVEKLFMTGGDLKKLRQAAHPSVWRKAIDEATFLLTNNLLWNYPTHIVNTTTNLYMLAARPAEKIIGGTLQGARGGAVRAQGMREYRYLLASLGDAWEGLTKAFLKGDSILSPHTDEYFQQGSRVNAPPIQWKPVRDTWDLFYNGLLAANYRQVAGAARAGASGAYRTGVGFPTRALGAVDEFVKVLRYRAMVQARAAGEASEAGLRGRDFRQHVQKQMDEAFSIDGRALDAEALQDSRIVTFQQELLAGTAGKAIQNFRHQLPITAMILPFVKTPVNVLRYSWKMTPGLNLLQTEYRQMLKGAMGTEAQAHAIGQMTLGATFMSIAAALSVEGRITGGGPADPVLKGQMLATGWRPYSIVSAKEDGTKEYFPLGRFDPIGLPFALVADLVDIKYLHPGTRQAQESELAVLVAIAKAFSEKTFLLNLNQALQAFTSPEDRMGRFVGVLGGNLVPASSALRNYFNADPYLRDARSVLDHAMKGLPAYSEGLPPRRDSFGDPIWRQRGLMSSSDMDVVQEEHSRIVTETGFGIRPPTPHRNGADLREITLEDGNNAYDLLQERAARPPRGPDLKTTLTRVIESDGYQELVDGPSTVKGTKLQVLADIVQGYRQRAYKSLLRDYPELRREVTKRQVDVREALRAKREAKREQPTADDLRKALEEMGF